jgi:membrane-associated phospholipid phosphatase
MNYYLQSCPAMRCLPRFNRRLSLAGVLLLTTIATPIEAQAPMCLPDEVPLVRSGDVPVRCLPALLLHDATDTLGAPLHWDQSDWLGFGLTSAAVVGTAAWIDEPIRNGIQARHSSGLDTLTRIAEPFGAEYAWGTLGVFGLAGVVFHDGEARSVAIDGVFASAIAAGVVSPVLKWSVGRSRPYVNEGPYQFAFLGGNASFPSGHTTQAFAVASVIAAHYRVWWVWTAAYGTAALVGYSRIYHDAHWTSDVLAGAAIGTAVGWRVVKLNSGSVRPGRQATLSVMPILGSRIYGLSATLRVP